MRRSINIRGKYVEFAAVFHYTRIYIILLYYIFGSENIYQSIQGIKFVWDWETDGCIVKTQLLLDHYEYIKPKKEKNQSYNCNT